MPEIATIQFRAKRRDDATRWFPGGYEDGLVGYRIPAFTANHVATPRPQQGTMHVLMFGPSASRDMADTRARALLKGNGLDPYTIFEDDADTMPDRVTISPDRGGFMATITLTLDLNKRA